MTPNEQTADSNKTVDQPPAILAGGSAARAANMDSDGVYTTELDPEMVQLDPALQQLREWTGNTRQEQSIDELARLIAEEGQTQDAVVRETDSGYVLIAGHRRREAVIRLRREGTLTAADQPFLLKVKVFPKVDDNRALRMALMENVQRENFTAIEFARAVVNVIRPRFGWDAKGKNGKYVDKNTAKVAGFLGVSPATVTEAEKLLRLPEGIQADVQAGRLTASAALDYTPVLDAAPEVVAQVAEKARQKAEREAAQTADRTAKEADRLEQQVEAEKAKPKAAGMAPRSDAHRTAKAERKARLARAAADKAAGVVASKSAKVKGKHVRAAVKESGVAGGKQKAPRMSEAVELFEGWTGALYPPVMVKFAQAFMGWAGAKLTDKAITRAWDDIADLVVKSPGQWHTTDKASDKADQRNHERGMRRQARATGLAARNAVAARKSAKRIVPAAKGKAGKRKAKKVK